MAVQNTPEMISEPDDCCGTDMFSECRRNDCYQNAPNGFPMVEEGEDAHEEKLDWRNSRGNAKAEYTRGSVAETRRMEDGYRKATIAIHPIDR